MNKGDIFLTNIPSENGHEQQGTRPAIIIANTPLPIAIIIPCTSKVQALRFPFTLDIAPTPKNGLVTSTIALIFQLRAIDKQKLLKKIGTLEPEQTKKIDSVLKDLLEL